ncbi:Tripartite-type tricarboxylate transporter, extracytoplasmic receptor component TctC [Cupriavidus necator]|uniref:Probable extra-cytoplasmic solute receptor n=1 Tax=Cupriavidus necator (strain ATCC 17699 / DSM 428 / KCTC 22496 / NCIMB 10442 / H16 / Stanier 337) TaxID=381666 RepID=Q0K196_CUPNH|nr:tripartite tricarboxylate transporter substrate binding protein [Cupriavidus necator H16]QQB78766.1 tripartite tricarboxylate transporter substrate binding protein [Cupriavidus necator]CAJ96228.1 probable extra-cytoplasmic solute receptor [Cupriavidus necator H16]
MHPFCTGLFRRLAKAAIPFLMAATAPLPALAAFPDKPIRMVVPFAPGGGTDLVARAMGITMGEDLGQPVIVDNKPGGSTIIGTDAVAKSAPDGYTLVMATLAHAVNPSLHKKLPFDTEKAFAPVMLVGRSPNVLVVKPDSPIKTVQDLIAAAKAKPGKLNYASQGAGTSAHLAGELFKNMARVDLNHIPYRGAGPAITDLLGGQVDVMFATAAAVAPHLESGKLRAVAVTTAQRSQAPALSKVPTIAESGVPNYVADSWYGLFVPAGTPPAVITRLNAAAKKAVHTDAFRKRAEQEGLAISGGTPDEFGRYVKAESQRWSKVIKDANITAD